MAVKKPIYITEKGYTQEINADLDSIEINSIQITAGGDIKIGAADGYGNHPVLISDDGYASFASGAFYVNPDGSVVSAAGALQVGADGALTVGTGAETASIDADGYMTLSAIETTATDGYAILTEGGKFYVKASDGYVKIGGFAQLMGGMSLGSDMSIAGSLGVTGAADFNGGVTANAIKIDGDTAQRLYIVGDDGYIKDESKLVFNGSKLSVTGDGYLSGALEVTGAADLNAALDVAGQVDLAASGVATNVRGNLTVSEVADFNAGVLASGVAIDGDVAQRLYIVGADGYIKDESKLVFNGSKLSVDGDGYLSGNLEVNGTASFQGLVDFNAGFTVSSIKIDGDVAQRLYIVDADGSMKDESKLVFNGSKLSVDADGYLSGALEVTGAADLNSSLDVAGQVDLAAAGVATSIRGNLNVAEVADFNAGILSSGLKIDGDVAQRLYIVGDDGYLKDESKLVFNGSKLSVTGDGYFSGALAVNGTASFDGLVDFNAGFTVSSIKIDGDVAQRLYIVDADGSMKDESKLVFNGSKLSVTGDGYFSGALEVAGAADLNGALDVAGQVDLAASGVATNIRGVLNVSEVADFNAGILSSGLKIDGDIAQRLYLVGADGYLKDEEKLVFNGSKLSVTGDGYFSGALEVTGALEVNGVADLLGGLNVSTEISVGAGSEAIILDGSTGDGYFAGKLEAIGQVDLAAAGVATNVHGTLNVSQVADFNAGILSSGVAIDGDVAQRLYIVGADGYIKDEADLVFDGSKLSVTGDGYFSGALEVAGAVSLHDDMSFIANKSISFAGNSGLISGLANLDGYSDGYAAANKNYVDMVVAAAGLDAASTSSSSLLAAESISIGDPIFIDSNGKAARGDTTSTLNEKAWVFGVAAAAAAADASVEVVRDGVAAGVLAGLGMSAGAKVWLAAGGGLTATKPTAGRLILMGFALSSSDLLVDVRDYGSFVA